MRYSFVDIASITRESRNDNIYYNSNKKSTGFLHEVFTIIESEAGARACGVYVESILNEWLPDWLKNRGYTAMKSTEPPSYYKFIKKQ